VSSKQPKLEKAVVIGLVVLLIPIWLPIVLVLAVIGLGFRFLSRLMVNLLVWTIWVPKGKSILFVSSESPIWKDYMEQEVLPLVHSRAERLNWSDRKAWKNSSLAVRCFRTYSGGRAFNPMVIIFHPFKPATQFRYFQAFRDFKHGKPEGVHAITRELRLALTKMS
jgi:hypothetical protein